MNVWTYWAGPKPEWIDICLKSIERCCKRSTFRLLTPETLPADLDLDPKWLEFPPGVGTDCLRAALLSQYGGLWIDADTVCLRDPIVLTEQIHRPDEFLYSTWPRDGSRAIAGYVYSPQGHPIAKRWHGIIKSYLPSAENLSWGDLGERALGMAIRGGGGKKWEMLIETFLPVDIDTNVKRYFVQSGFKDFVTPRTIAFGLNYSWMMEHRRVDMSSVPFDQPAGERLMIHHLLIHAKGLNDDAK